MTTGIKEEHSPLQREIGRMANTVSCIAVSLGLVLFFMARFLGIGWVDGVLFALGVMVCCVPEGLPATFSVTLAIGIQRLARGTRWSRSCPPWRHSVRRRSSAPTRPEPSPGRDDREGGVGRRSRVHGERCGLRSGGRVLVDGQPAGDDADLVRMVRIAALCNNARLLAPDELRPRWRDLGDPTEAALLVAAAKARFDLGAVTHATHVCTRCLSTRDASVCRWSTSQSRVVRWR